MVCEV